MANPYRLGGKFWLTGAKQIAHVMSIAPKTFYNLMSRGLFAHADRPGESWILRHGGKWETHVDSATNWAGYINGDEVNGRRAIAARARGEAAKKTAKRDEAGRFKVNGTIE